MDPYLTLVFTTLATNAMQYLAWPVTLLIVLWILKKEIRALIARIKKGKFGAAELEFAEQVATAEAEFQTLYMPDMNVQVDDALSEDSVESISQNPSNAILEAWRNVDKAMTDVLDSHGISYRALRTGKNLRTGATIKIKSANLGALSALRALQKSNLVEADVIALINDLRALRNEAAHNQDFDPPLSSVMRYLKLAEHLIGRLRLEVKPTH